MNPNENLTVTLDRKNIRLEAVNTTNALSTSSNASNVMYHNQVHYVSASGSGLMNVAGVTTGTVAAQSQMQPSHTHPIQQSPSGEIFVRNSVVEMETVVSLDQCCMCSTFYESPSRQIPQPDLNKIICTALEVTPSQPSFYRSYVPLCVNCTNLLRKFDRLRVELEFVKTQVVQYVIDSLTQIRVEGGSQLDHLKDQIIDRWTNGTTGTKDKRNEKGKDGFAVAEASIDSSWTPQSNIVTIVTNRASTGNESWTTVPSNDATDISDENPTNEESYSIKETHDTVGFSILPDEGRTVGEIVSLPDAYTNTGRLSGRKEKDKTLQNKRTSTRKRQGPFICLTCGRLFSQRISYNGHVQACSSEDPGVEKICTICSTEDSTVLFPTWGDFKTHVDLNHPFTNIETCTKCKMTFLPNGLKLHVCTHKGHVAKEAIFQCDRCDRAYNTRCNLVDHVRRMHQDQKHKCEYCDKVYGSPALLEFHLERHKRFVSSFKCKFCNLCFTTNYGLREHTKRHTGEKSLECNICGKKFANLSVLKTHKTVHASKTPYVCDICGNRFKLKSSLSRHIPRHQIQDTNYTKKCPLCPNAIFRRIWILKEHMERKHPGTNELNQVLLKYREVDDRPRYRRSEKVVRKKRSTLNMPTKEDISIDEESSSEEVLPDASSVKDLKPDLDENSISSEPGLTPSRQSARLISKGENAKRVLVLLKDPELIEKK